MLPRTMCLFLLEMFYDDILLSGQPPWSGHLLVPEGGRLMLVYSETHKTMNTRNIYRMLLGCEKQANNNKAWDN